MATVQRITLINNGLGLWMDHGDSVINILPQGVDPRAVENVERYYQYESMRDHIALKFKNGHVAILRFGFNMEIDPEHLKEFQATCIMVHDI